MSSEHSSRHSLSPRLEPGQTDSILKFQLNQQHIGQFVSVTITTFETEREVTLVCNNLHEDDKYRKLDLLDALRSGLLELVDSVGKSLVTFPAPKPRHLGRRNISPTPSPQHYQVSTSIKAQTTDPLWKEILQPGHTYEVRFSKDRDELWAYYTDTYEGPPEDIPESVQRLLVRREPETIQFKVYDVPAPAKAYAKLSMPSECHLYGPGDFTFCIEYSTDSERPITICKARSPLSSNELLDLTTVEYIIEAHDIENGEQASWPAFFGCWDFDPHPEFPGEEDFVEIVKGKPWRYECTLLNRSDPEPGTVRSLSGFDAGRRYSVQISSRVLRFSKWLYGAKEELLKGDLEEKKRRWEEKREEQMLGILEVEIVNDPVEFDAVK